MNIQKLGWAAAALMAVGLIGMGFQTTPPKFGTVDMEKVFNDSTFAKTQTDNLRNMGELRQSVLVFVNTYRTVTVADATKFRDLTIKPNASAAEKAETERIKSDATKTEARYRELTTKAGLTPEEAKEVEELNRRKEATGELLQTWQQAFMDEVSTKQNGLRAEALGKVRQAVQKVARDQGYTIIFDQNVAPYSANDVTDEAMKVMNTMK
jgi:Skp family chaperone for outer membrane proteins